MASEAIVARLKAVLSGDSSQLRADLGKAERSLKDFGQNATKVGRSLTTKVTLPMVGLGVAAVKTAADFETSMTKITALVGVAKDEVDSMSGAVRTMATQFGKSANEAADALFYITSAGLRGATATDTLAASLKASAIGLGDTATIADLATSALNAYGADVLSATQATDVMTATIREGKLETTELAGSMGRVLPLASAMGVNFNEVGAAFAALSRTGTNAAEAATQIRGIQSSLLRPTKQAEEALTEMGLSSEGLRRQMREEGLLATLKTLSEEFAGNEAAAASVFGNIRALSGVLDLMGANVETTEAIFASMADTTGAVDEAFAAVSETTAFKFQQAMAEMKETLLSLGERLLPIVSSGLELVSDAVRGVTGFFEGLSPATQDILIGLGGVLAIAGPVALGIGGVTTAVVALASAMAAHPVIAAFAATLGLVAIAAKDMLAEAREARERTDAMTQAFEEADDPAFNLIGRFEELAEAVGKYKREVDGTGDATSGFVGQALLESELAAAGLLDTVKATGIEMSALSELNFEAFGEFNDPSKWEQITGFVGKFTGALRGVETATAVAQPTIREYLENLVAAGGASAHMAAALLAQADAGLVSDAQLRDLVGVLANFSDASANARQENEDSVREFLKTGDALAAFVGTGLYERAADLINEVGEGNLSAVDAQQQLNAMLEDQARNLAENEARMEAHTRAMADNTDQAYQAVGGQDAFIQALATANEFIGHDITKVQELVHELGILDGLSTETKIAIGLEIDGLDEARELLRGIIDVMLKIDRIPMALAEKNPKFQAAIEALRSLDKIATGEELPGFAADVDKASSGLSDLEKAEREAAREAERLQREIDKVAESIASLGTELVGRDFFEFMLGASADDIERKFYDIGQAAMVLVEQAEALGLAGGPEFLQTLANIGTEFDRLASLQSQVASTQEDITDVQSRLTSATNDLASAQAHLNDLNAKYLGTRTPTQQLADATNALAEAQKNLNRENDRYAAFLYGEGAGGGTFEDALRAEIDIYRNLQRELSGVESAQSGFRQRIVDMMSPTVAGAAGAGGVMGNLGNILAQARTFRNNLIELRDRGYPTDVIGQVVGAGMTQGNVISKRLLALGTAEFQDFLALREEIGRLGVETAAIAGEVIFGADIADAQGAVREQFAIVDRMFQSAIAEAEASQQAQQAIVDAMFRNAIAEAETAVRVQEETVERLRATLHALETRLEDLRSGIETLAADIQTAMRAAFDQFLAGLNAAISRLPDVRNLPAPTSSGGGGGGGGGGGAAPSAAPAPTPAPAPAPAPTGYSVQRGDSLWAIAARELGSGTRWREIQQANNISGTLIHPGQALTIPGRARGGRVSGGHPYLVGEMGPELFIPGESGGILSNRATSQVGGGVVNYNISVTANGDPAEAGRQIVKAIQEYERRNGNRWRSS